MCFHDEYLGRLAPSLSRRLSPTCPPAPLLSISKPSTTCTLRCVPSPICSLHSPLSNKGWNGSRETDDILYLLQTEECLECRAEVVVLERRRRRKKELSSAGQDGDGDLREEREKRAEAAGLEHPRREAESGAERWSTEG